MMEGLTKSAIADSVECTITRTRDPQPPPPPPFPCPSPPPRPLHHSQSSYDGPEAATKVSKSREFSAHDKDKGLWLVADLQVEPEMQVGPTCGLVALRMAASALLAAASSDIQTSAGGGEGGTAAHLPRVCEVQELLAHAVERGFSAQGEMFSADELAVLAREHCSLHTHMVHDASAQDICALLEQGRLLLLAYDADKDNSPCLLGGTRAHWALVRGLVIPPTCKPAQRLLLSSHEAQAGGRKGEGGKAQREAQEQVGCGVPRPSSYYYICVLILLHMLHHTITYVSSYYYRSRWAAVSLGPLLLYDYYLCPHTTHYLTTGMQCPSPATGAAMVQAAEGCGWGRRWRRRCWWRRGGRVLLVCVVPGSPVLRFLVQNLY